MFKNYRLFYLLLAAVIVISATVILLPKLLSRQSNPNFQIYTDKEFGYQLEVPKDWHPISTSNPVQFFTASSSGTRKLMMEILAIPQNLPLADYISSQNSSTSGNLRQFQLKNQSVYEEKTDSYLSYYLQNPRSPVLYIMTFNTNLAIDSQTMNTVLSGFEYRDPANTSPYPLPTTASSSASFQCPESGWVDCMPGTTPQKIECTENFVSWASANCPDFKGIAY